MSSIHPEVSRKNDCLRVRWSTKCRLPTSLISISPRPANSIPVSIPCPRHYDSIPIPISHPSHPVHSATNQTKREPVFPYTKTASHLIIAFNPSSVITLPTQSSPVHQQLFLLPSKFKFEDQDSDSIRTCPSKNAIAGLLRACLLVRIRFQVRNCKKKKVPAP